VESIAEAVIPIGILTGEGESFAESVRPGTNTIALRIDLRRRRRSTDEYFRAVGWSLPSLKLSTGSYFHL